MAINRFYSPQRSQYISQFVPNQLPTDLMMGMLANKQKQEDDKQATLAQDRLFDWEIVPGAMQDKKDKDAILGELYSKIDEFSTKDITTDPAAWQEYKTFTRNLQNNEKIKAMKAYRAQYDSYQENRAKIIQDPNKYGGGEALYKQDREWDRYTTGEGYLGKGYQGLTEARERFDVDNEFRKSYSALKADSTSTEKIGELFKTGYSLEEIAASGKGNKIEATTLRHFEAWRQGPVGKAIEDIVDQQLGLDYAEKAAILNDPEAARKYETLVNNTLYERAMAVGQDYTVKKEKSTISDRSVGNIQRDQDAKARINHIGMGSKSVDPEALIESYDQNRNGIGQSLKELQEAYKIQFNQDKLFSKDGTVNDEEYNKIISELKGIAETSPARDSKAIRDRIKDLESMRYNVNYVADAEEYGKYMTRAAKDAVTKMSNFWGINSEEIAKYIDDTGNLDTSPLLEKVISTGIGDKISSSSTLGYQLKMALTAIIGNNELVLPETKDAYSHVAKEVATSKFLQADLINAGMTPEEVTLFIKAYGAEGGKDSRGGKYADNGLENFNFHLQESKSIWRKNYKYNKNNEPIQDSQHYTVHTPATDAVQAEFDKGTTLSFKVVGTDKVVQLSKVHQGDNVKIGTDLKRLDKNGRPIIIAVQTADEEGNYYNYEKGKFDKATPGEVISTQLYDDTNDSKSSRMHNTSFRLREAAASAKDPQEQQRFIEAAEIQESNQRPVSGGAGSLYRWVDGYKEGTKNVPMMIKSPNGQWKTVSNVNVTTVKNKLGEKSMEIYVGDQKYYTNIENKSELPIALERIAKQLELQEASSSGGNLSPY